MEHLRGHISGLARCRPLSSMPLEEGARSRSTPITWCRSTSTRSSCAIFEGRIVAYEEPRDYTGMVLGGQALLLLQEEILREGTDTPSVSPVCSTTTRRTSLSSRQRQTPDQREGHAKR